MSYQRERDEFIVRATQEGLTLDQTTKLLRYASTLQRLAVAQCNGDWPADNGERKTKECPKCGSGFVPSSFRKGVCPDCRTAELVNECLRGAGYGPVTFDGCLMQVCWCHIDPHAPDFQCSSCGCTAVTPKPLINAVFGGDPRGAVLRLSTPRFPYDECGRNGANGLYVPARER